MYKKNSIYKELYNESINTQFPFILRIFKRKKLFKRKDFEYNSLNICIEFKNSFTETEISELKKYIKKQIGDDYSNLNLRFFTQRSLKILISIIGCPEKKSIIYNILMGNKEALLYLRYPSYKIIDDRYVVINNISSLAKFSIFVLNNQHNWDFIYEKKEEGR